MDVISVVKNSKEQNELGKIFLEFRETNSKEIGGRKCLTPMANEEVRLIESIISKVRKI